MINDKRHDYGTMLHYISLSNQRRQLETIGYAKTVRDARRMWVVIPRFLIFATPTRDSSRVGRLARDERKAVV